MNEKIKKNILNSNKTIKDAIKLLEFSLYKYKIIVVINKNKKIVGTVTDGDIRRSIIKNTNVNNKVSKIMNLNPITISQDIDQQEILRIMKTNMVKHILIVDKLERLIDIIAFEDLLPILSANVYLSKRCL